MMNFLRRFLPARSTASITRSLTTMSQQLRDHAKAQSEQAVGLQVEATALRVRASEVFDDATRASATAARLEELLG